MCPPDRSDSVYLPSRRLATGSANNRAEGVANIKQILIEHTGNSLEEQFRDEVEDRSRSRGFAAMIPPGYARGVPPW